MSQSYVIIYEILHTFVAGQNSTGPEHSHSHRKGFQLEEINNKAASEILYFSLHNETNSRRCECTDVVSISFLKGLQLFLDIGNNEAQAIHFTSKKHSGHFIENTIEFKKTRATVECLFFRVLKFPEYFKTV